MEKGREMLSLDLSRNLYVKRYRISRSAIFGITLNINPHKDEFYINVRIRSRSPRSIW
ncbi:unnamed protein product [Arabidopsis halleri]